MSREPYRCACGASSMSSLDAARLSGWRIWDGESQTGKPMQVRICPGCAGDENAPAEPSWRVGCRSCDWEYYDEDDSDGPLAEKDARQMARDHECEPDVWVKPPLTEREVSEEAAMFARVRAAMVPVDGAP